MNKENLEVLQFIYDRLECVYEENPRYDYMTEFNKIIQAEQLILSGVSCSASDVISKIKNLPESDFSQDGQLKLLRVCGNALGLYKAVKWMQKNYS